MSTYNKEYYEKNKERMAELTAKYHADHTVFVGFRFSNKKDADVIAKLNDVPKKVDYVRALIRDDIARTGWRPPEVQLDPVAEPVETVTVTPEDPASVDTSGLTTEQIREMWGI